MIFLVVLIVAWRWRAWREAARVTKKKHAKPDLGLPSDMVSCRHCGLHVPANEAVIGALGTYCSSDHKLKLEP